MGVEHPLLHLWKTQRRDVIRHIARDRDRFWYWKIRLRVLDYLLSRYSQVPADSLPHPDDINSLESFARPPGDLPSTAVGVRTSRHLRELLERIHTNVHAVSRN